MLGVSHRTVESGTPHDRSGTLGSTVMVVVPVPPVLPAGAVAHSKPVYPSGHWHWYEPTATEASEFDSTHLFLCCLARHSEGTKTCASYVRWYFRLKYTCNVGPSRAIIQGLSCPP